MNEEAVDAPAQAEEASETAERPRPRRRRRGGRGRTRSAPRERQDEQSAGEQEQVQEADRSEAEAPSEGERKAPTSKSAARRRLRRRAAAARKPKEADAQGDAGSENQDASEGDETAAGAAKKPRARRRKSSTSRSSSTASKGSQQGTEGKDGGKAEEADDASSQDGESTSTRRRRRKSGGAKAPATKAKAEAKTKEQPAKERVKAPAKKGQGRKPAAAESTRTRSRRKPQGGRRGREAPVQVPRRTDKIMVITEHGDRDQIAVLEGRELAEHYVTRAGATSMVGNIYVGKVQNVLPGMEAAFVDVGRGRNAVLYAGEVAYDEDALDGESRRIERQLKAGQGVLVQVTKEPMGGKGARLTGQISLPGRYLVYVPDGGVSGISRRLPEKERTRLRKVVKKIQPKEGSLIVRTAAEGVSEEELGADLDRLKKTWDSIKRRKRGRAPKLLYEEPELTVRVVRDAFSPTEFEKIVTDSGSVHEKVTAYLRDVAPDLVDKVELHKGKLSAFEEYHVTEQIHKALERKVWLPSGGYLIIDRSEAMTIIDVNTGKHVGKTNLEETVTGTNLEAAKEIARQLRLRDIGGIIVIDFIDMLLPQNRELVIQTLKEALAADRTRSQVFDITPLGLLEMTRKKVSAGLVEVFSETCPTCEGRGILLTHES
jgi:ribonuclease E